MPDENKGGRSEEEMRAFHREQLEQSYVEADYPRAEAEQRAAEDEQAMHDRRQSEQSGGQ